MFTLYILFIKYSHFLDNPTLWEYTISNRYVFKLMFKIPIHHDIYEALKYDGFFFMNIRIISNRFFKEIRIIPNIKITSGTNGICTHIRMNMYVYIYTYIWVYSIQELITVFQNDEALGIHNSSLQCFIEVMHFS